MLIMKILTYCRVNSFRNGRLFFRKSLTYLFCTAFSAAGIDENAKPSFSFCLVCFNS
jgi:hypothetical protein